MQRTYDEVMEQGIVDLVIVVDDASHDETVVSILGREILGRNVLYYGYQVATAGVLFLAANTAYADFPRLSAILGKSWSRWKVCVSSAVMDSRKASFSATFPRICRMPSLMVLM